MITRRNAILALALGSGFVAWGLPPGDFWNDKQPGEWAEKDVQRLLTKSPWAKDATVELNFGDMGGPGMGPAGMDGPGGFGGPGGMTAVVRWETARPYETPARPNSSPTPPGST